ncbi:MAG: hypothetical protein GWN37_16635, partial [Gammaproteobacteria bacterium]|nr:hypothetical protein [Gammaproteobacteria bacterium]
MTRDRRLILNWEPWFVAQLSEAYRSAGQLDRAIETALEAIEIARRIGTPIWECQAEVSLARALVQ